MWVIHRRQPREVIMSTLHDPFPAKGEVPEPMAQEEFEKLPPHVQRAHEQKLGQFMTDWLLGQTQTPTHGSQYR